jgi:hypothetical protein
MIDWALAFTTASNALKLANDLRTIDKEYDKAELKLKIADLTVTLADLKTTLIEAKAEAAGKDETIAQLKRVNRRVADDLVEYRGYHYRKQPDNDQKPAGNPFCVVCMEKDGLLFETSTRHATGRPVQCPHCEARYDGVTTFIN